MREIVFAHIPKTAGTSLRNGLVDALPDHFHLFDYGTKSVKTTHEFADVIFNNQTLRGMRERIPNGTRTFVSGHFQIGKYWRVFHPSSFVVFVRDPIERLFSEYFHFVRNTGYKHPIERFINERRFRNRMYAHFAIDIDKIGFIGDADRYNESVAALSRRLGCKIEQRRDNAGDAEKYRDLLSDNKLMKKVRRQNREDIDLHRYLVEEVIPKNWARIGAPMSPLRVTGKVERASADRIEGYAFDMEGLDLVDVDVFVGGRKVLTVRADQFHQELRVNKRVASGIGGFAITRQDLADVGLAATDDMRLTVSVLGRELRGSPIKLRQQPAAGG